MSGPPFLQSSLLLGALHFMCQPPRTRILSSQLCIYLCVLESSKCLQTEIGGLRDHLFCFPSLRPHSPGVPAV